MVKSGQVCEDIIVCKDGTGALATPSVGPVGVLYVNGVANGATVTITGSNPYTWSVTLPALDAGDLVAMYITATIATIATAEIVWREVADTVRESETYTRLGAPAGASVSADIAATRGAIIPPAIVL